METYQRQRAAAQELRVLNEAQAQAQMQTQLTNTRVQAQIAESQGEADLARAKKQAEQMVVTADAELARSRRQAEQTVVLAEARSQEQDLTGRGESQRIMQVGQSEAEVLEKKISSYGDPRLYALSLVAAQLAHSQQPLVPEQLFIAGGNGHDNGNGHNTAGSGMLGLLIDLLVAEKAGFPTAAPQPVMRPRELPADVPQTQVSTATTAPREIAG
jgi:uncharacterized membrane protein YqiK